jgi:hypothetical protein
MACQSTYIVNKIIKISTSEPGSHSGERTTPPFSRRLQQRQRKAPKSKHEQPVFGWKEQEASCLLQNLLQQPSQTVDAGDESVVGSVVHGRVAATGAKSRVRKVDHSHVDPRRAPRPLQLLGRRPLFLRAQRIGAAPTLAAELHVGRFA